MRRPGAAGAARPRTTTPAVVVVLAGLVAALAMLAVVHLGQGTADVRLGDVVTVLLGRPAPGASEVVLASRLPRMEAGVLVGLALGAAGCALQGLARNPLASPDTLAVNAGAYLALTIVAAFGLALGPFGGTAVAFAGGIVAALAVLGLVGRDPAPARLVLVGTVFSLGLAAGTSALLLVFSQETQGLFAWGAGSLSQPGGDAIAALAAPILLAVAVTAALGPRLDLLGLGEDAARSLGVRVGAVRAGVVALAVLLAAASVTLVGPLGFVGLAAPATIRLAAGRVPGLARHSVAVPASALFGAVLVLAADVGLRLVLTGTDSLQVPTGVVTSLLGAVFLVALSQGMRTGRADASPASVGAGRRRPAGALLALAAAAVACLGVLGLLAGDGWLLLGDLGNWVRGVASRRIDLMLDARLPRVLAAALAGAALAIAGALAQAVTRNPLADPGVLGVSAGAGAGALVAIVFAPGSGFAGITAGALAGALTASGFVFGLAARGGFEPTRLVLVGIGIATAATAVTTMLVVGTDPWNQAKAITWLGGSTYGAALPRLAPLAVVLGVGAAAALALARRLDLLQLDADTPRLLSVPVGRTRLAGLATAVSLTTAATTGVGVIGFVGLVAPHAARLLVGPRHRVLLPLAALIGAALVLVSDIAGRSLLAPAQLPVGLVCSLVGAPYFISLLWKMRSVR